MQPPVGLKPGELTSRIFTFCQHLLTPAERNAHHSLSLQTQIVATKQQRRRVRQGTTTFLPFDSVEDALTWHERALHQYEQDLADALTPDAAKLLEDGREAFYDEIDNRFLREHRDAVLNPCPRCGAMTRTPRARQCRACGHDWH